MSAVGVDFARPESLWLLLSLPIIAVLGMVLRRRHQIPGKASWLRIAAVALLILAIAEPLRATSQSAGATVFVVDQSASLSDSTLTDVQQWVNTALDSAESGDRAAVISFADSPALAGPVGSAGNVDATLQRDTSDPELARQIWNRHWRWRKRCLLEDQSALCWFLTVHRTKVKS